MTHHVITGMGVLCPGAADVPALTDLLRQGRSLIRRLEDGRVGALFDPDLPGSPDGPAHDQDRRLRHASRASRAAVGAVEQAWTSAGLDDMPAERIGLVLAGNNLSQAASAAQIKRCVDHPTFINPRYALQFVDTEVLSVLGDRFPIRGPALTVGGSAASGAGAMYVARRLLARKDDLPGVDVCLCVGALADFSPYEHQAFINLGAMCPPTPETAADRLCRPFDAAARGFVLGESCACVVLETASSAERRGATARVQVAGTSYAMHKGPTGSGAEPSEDGESRAMSEALAEAGLSPADVDYVNAHATGTPLGDAVECRAVRQALGLTETAPDEPSGPWINSSKSLLGHGFCAAGLVELVAVIVQMEEGFLHPNLNLDRAIDSGLRFVGPGSVDFSARVAINNSFSYGGLHGSVVLRREL